VTRFTVAATAIVFLLNTAEAPAQVSTESQTTKIVLDANAIAKFSPRARADVVVAIVSRWQLASTAGINSPLRVQHFMAQLATETGGLQTLEENLNYSAERLREVFPSRCTEQEALQLAHKPIAIANHVYNGRLGNKPPMDGWNYRGSGLIQLTGRANFAARGAELKMQLEALPDLVRTPDYAFQTAVAYWTARALNAPADADDIVKVRLLVNGGSNGLPDARIWFARARQTWPSGSAVGEAGGTTLEESTAVKDQLSALGFLEQKSYESTNAGEVSDALRRFQESRGLPATGIYDESTLYALTDPSNIKKE
jgi:putative chitinase